MILIIRTVVAQRTNLLCELLVICDRCTSITQRPQVLARIEAKTGCVSEGADHLSFVS